MTIKKSDKRTMSEKSSGIGFDHKPSAVPTHRRRVKEHKRNAPEENRDFSADFEAPITILEDLTAIAIDEIGNGSGRAISVLLSAIRFLNDIKAINQRLLHVESSE